MPYAKTGRLQIYHERCGHGHPLLFIGGVGGDLRGRPNVFDSPLCGHFDLVAFDQRNTGRTEKPDHSCTLIDYVDDTLGLMDWLGWHQAHIVGVSFGGMVAQELAIRHPERVRGLVLACTTAGGKGGSSYPLHELSGLPPEARARALLGIVDTRRNEDWQARHPDQADELVRQALETRPAFLAEPGGSDGFERQLQARRSHDSFERLPRIKAQTLVCAGRYDAQASLDAVLKMHARIPDAQLRLYEGGHAFLGQDPAAWRDILGFLSKTQASSDVQIGDSAISAPL